MINRRFHRAFTLLELVIVLAIIATMIIVVAPYASRSNEGLQLNNQMQEFANTLRYAIDYAETNGKQVRFVMDTNRNFFYLETVDENGVFSIMPTSIGREKPFNSNCTIMNIDGFEMEGQSYFLLFNPTKEWPTANFTILGEDFKKTLNIITKTISIKDNV